jgi:LCP family protein required for cell wall assembly
MPTTNSQYTFALREDELLPEKPSFQHLARPSLGAGGPRRQSRKRKAFRLGLIFLGIGLLGAGGWAYLQYRSLTSAVNDLHAGAKAPVVKQAQQELNVAPKHDLKAILHKQVPAISAAQLDRAETILVVGSDRRWGESGGRSDSMMLVRVDPAQKTVSILSIPRDLRVPIPGHGYDKVNAAFAYGGDRLLIATLRDYFGVKINHFVETNFRGFGQMVGALGGVYLPVDGRYYNHNVGSTDTNFADINLLPGYQLLNGTQALQYVRFRHFDNDFYRAARQQLFLREVERQVIADKYDYGRMKSLIQAFTKNTASDLASLGEIWKLVNAVRATPADRVVREVLPTEDASTSYGYYLQVNTPQKVAVIARWYDPRAKIRTQNIATATLSGQGKKAKPQRAPTDASLVADSQGLALVRAQHFPAPYCGLTKIPAGYSWGNEYPMRHYQLAGHPALAGWLTKGSGVSALLMETTWTAAPVLSRPTREFRRGSRSYQVWTDSGTIRQVAWRMGPTVAWLTNTLRNELSARQMMALAASCRAVY